MKIDVFFEKRFRIPKTATLIVLFLLGIIGTGLVYDFASNAIQRKQSTQFVQDAQEEIVAIQNNIENNLQILYGIDALFSVIGNVQRQQFSIIADIFSQRFAAIQFLVWAPKVTAAERTSFVTSVQRQYPNFNLYTISEKGEKLIDAVRLEYFPIFYIAPFLENEKMFGFDLNSNLIVKSAMDKACDLGIMTITAKLHFLANKDNDDSIFAMVPVYKYGLVLDSVAKRRASLVGFVLGSYRMSDLLEKGIDKKYRYPIDFEFSDLTTTTDIKQLYTYKFKSDITPTLKQKFVYTYRMTIADHVWFVRAAAHGDYYQKDAWILWLVLIASIGFFGLVLLLVYRFYEILEKIEKLIQIDPLTRVPNKFYFEEALKREIGRAQRHNSFLFLMYIDIDKFKNINDKYGHHVGDLFLRAAAKRIKESLRVSDFIARLGGDEFAVILSDLKQKPNVIAIARKIMQRFHEPFVISGRKIHATISIGVAEFPEDAVDATELLQKADTAMYRVKRAGRNNFQCYRA